jgi:predicted RNA-binding Zn ribbon-like protein
VIFAHDTEHGLIEAAALINTARADGEGLPDIAALDAFVRTWGWTGRRDRDEAELRAVRALRPRLREIWEADEDRVVEIVNRLLRDGHALPQLVKHDGWDYHLHATPSDAPLASRMAVDAAMAVLEVVRTKELSRLRICELPGCDDVVVDLSKNRSKRYCEGSCGNRAAVAAYRARKAGTDAAEPAIAAPRRSPGGPAVRAGPRARPITRPRRGRG